MGYDFTRTRACSRCGRSVKADRAIPRDEVYCPACKYLKLTPNTPDVPASEPDGETNHE